MNGYILQVLWKMNVNAYLVGLDKMENVHISLPCRLFFKAILCFNLNQTHFAPFNLYAYIAPVLAFIHFFLIVAS